MKENQYEHKTPGLGIPVPGDNDCIWPDVEMRKWTIIENLLMGASRATPNCLFKEGSMSVKPDGDKFKAVMVAAGGDPSAEGLTGGNYFLAPSTLEWTGLEAGNSYLLYLVGSQATILDPSQVRPASSTTGLGSSRAVLVAAVSLRGETVLDMRPKGKVIAGKMGLHMSDSENPHGEILRQSVLEAGKLSVGGDEVKLPQVMELKSGGKNGVVLEAKAPVKFALAQGCAFGVGEISVGYHGSDSKVEKPECFVVYNAGNEGVPIRVIIFF